MRSLVLSGCAPDRFVRLAARLLGRSPESPLLLVAELDGDAILLGRHQRARSAVQRDTPNLHRRLGGGRAISVGEGTIGVLVVSPPAGFRPAQAINRLVRGLLAGLRKSGIGGAFYFGRDFVSADHRQVAVVSFDGLPDGTLAFEAYLAHRRPLALAAGVSRYPAHHDPRAGGPAYVTMADLWRAPRGAEEVAAAIVAGYGAAPGPFDLDEGPDPEPAVEEEEQGFAESGLAEVPIGFVEALLRHRDDRVVEARVRGDFMAPAFAVRGLERALAGGPLSLAEIGARVDAAFQQPGAAIAGVTNLRVLAEVVAAAAIKPA